MSIGIVFFALILQQSGTDGSREPAPLTAAAYYRARAEADALFERRDWAAATASYDRLVASFPADGDGWRRLAIGSYYVRDYARAIDAFERAVGLGFGNSASQQLNLASCHALVGARDAAFACIDAALAARYENRAALEGVGDLAVLHDDPRWDAALGRLPAGDWSRDDGWRFDLEYLVSEARRQHADPERPAFGERFADEAAELNAEIPELSDEQILVRMMRLVAILDDGHSALYGPGADTPLEFDPRVLPFKLYLFPRGLYVVDGVGAWAQYAGRRVTRFGDVPAEEVLERMSGYRGVDNPMTWRWMGPQFYVRRVAMLRAVGVEVTGDTVELSLETGSGGSETLAVETGEFPLVRKLRPSPAATGEVPRYLASVDANYWMEALPDHDAIYFQFNQVRDGGSESLAEAAERLRKAAESATSLIVDVRHNNGGNNSLVRPLVRALVEFEMRSPDHRIFVITGRNTFSAAQNFINRVERWTGATFVGEPSSSSPNFVGEETELVLPYSRIRGSLSTRYWQDSDPGDQRAWITPDVPVELTAADYFAGVDPALDAIIELLSGE